MAKPAPTDPTEGDDGALHAFWAFVLRRHASVDDVNDPEQLKRLLDAFNRNDGG